MLFAFFNNSKQPQTSFNNVFKLNQISKACFATTSFFVVGCLISPTIAWSTDQVAAQLTPNTNQVFHDQQRDQQL
jgi:hypothetical protein